MYGSINRLFRIIINGTQLIGPCLMPGREKSGDLRKKLQKKSFHKNIA